jgi:hypothetical protein
VVFLTIGSGSNVDGRCVRVGIDGSKTALDGGVTALRGAKAGNAVLCDIIVLCTLDNFWPNALPSGAIAPL